MDNPKHAKIKTFTPQDDGSMMIETESYHEKLSGYKQEIMKHINTNKSSFLSDLIASVDVITSQKTKEVTLTITADDSYFPKQITKVYTVKKETYNKR